MSLFQIATSVLEKRHLAPMMDEESARILVAFVRRQRDHERSSG